MARGGCTSTGIYSGAILTVALVWVWIRRRALSDRRALITAATVFAGFTFILALGRYGGTRQPPGALAGLPVASRAGAAHRPRPVRARDCRCHCVRGSAGDRRTAQTSSRRLDSALWIPAGLGVVTTIALNSGLLPYGRHTFESATHAARASRWCRRYAAGPSGGPAGGLGARRARGRHDGRSRRVGHPVVYREPAKRIEELAHAAPVAPPSVPESYAFAARYSRTSRMFSSCADTG